MGDLIKISEIFSIEYGNQMDKNKLISTPGGINFVSRSAKNLGVVDKVNRVPNIKPYDADLITVALGGSLLSAFVQPDIFYTAQNIKVLRPLSKMSFNEKVFYCNVIAHNRYRYATFGREANKTFDGILVPPVSGIPKWVNTTKVVPPTQKPVLKKPPYLDMENWVWFEYQELFEIKKGRRLTKANMDIGKTPFIGAIEFDNGYRQFIAHKPLHPGNTITVNYNGSVAEAFYQPKPFLASDDVNVLYPKFKMNIFIGLFISSLIKLEKYRFNYGRKWRSDRMRQSLIKLPVDRGRRPDFRFMESYVKSLSYSSSL